MHTRENESCLIVADPSMGHDSQGGVISDIETVQVEDPMAKIRHNAHLEPAKRKNQNRAAQRAFRQRKEQYVKELETTFHHVQDTHRAATAHLIQENQRLRAIAYRLHTENAMLKQKATQRIRSRRLQPYTVDWPRDLTAPLSAAGHGKNISAIARKNNNIKSTAHEETTSEKVTEKDQVSITDRTPSTDQPIGDMNCGVGLLERSLSQCHITDEQSFCSHLGRQVCDDAFAQLLFEPLFDENGMLNVALENRPVPISPMLVEQQGNEKQQEPYNELRLLNCSEIWHCLYQHPRFQAYNLVELCQMVKQVAQCAPSGVVLEARALDGILERMNYDLSGLG
ncbi:uncharacterized protein BYT42DRAFT_566353 [Radiomyces spectabilis]|uniref:uncharacterized protein n=1 Tax=Radiomyces spectabilis TaxID=64574 RepID=UPI002220EB71|nr:uncharacterized protein BYT42DRAFT_566353 [Radiomyces spectabilis]KAI8381391.1 hypothetical protein BYT42DRAFT_566353 [Radiomyces spectabilis]